MKREALGWFILMLVVSARCSSQSSAPKASPNNPSIPGTADANAGQPLTGNIGFSIETEMLTYKSIEADSQAVACEIARYLGTTSAVPPKTLCVSASAKDNSSGVVVVSSKNALLADFQLWRTDMAVMNGLELRAGQLCAIQPPATKSPGTLGPSILDLTPAGQAVSLIPATIGLFASNQSVSQVVGTVQDQALMNEVAGQLTTLKVSVLVPEIYSPYALGGTDYANSPFLSSFTKLIDIRSGCLEEAEKDASENQKQSASSTEISSLIANIDNFIAIVTGTTPTTSATQSQAGRVQPEGALGSTVNQTSTESTSHIEALMVADGLARAIEVKPDGTMPAGSPWHYMIWLKALESGGSLTKTGSIFGSKVSFSGGAVVTYALFSLDGKLVCSGNVFDYAGFIAAKGFRDTFVRLEGDRSRQLPVLSGTCNPQKISN